ncbi:MAG: hypothetical protein KDB53_12140, partial [Planctomycetes bacterium]|nr:hypothetical protein [Planctomycetota bacterium]
YAAAGGDLISLSFTSPGQSLDGMNFVAAVAFFPTGTMLNVLSLSGDPSGTGIWLPPATSFVFIDGLNNLVFTPVIGPGGYVHHSIMPPQLAGTGSSIGIQAAVTAPNHNPFNIGLTNMAEFVVL